MNVLDLYIEDVGDPRKAGSEYQGPCPACQGTDRFCLYPDQGSEKAPGMGTYHCGHGKGGNGCGKGGDAIQYLIDFRQLSFKDACGYLGIEVKGGSQAMYYRAPSAPRTRNKKFSAVELGYPSNVENPHLWSKKGLEFVDRCHLALLDREKTIDYLAGRGISMAAIKKYQLGFNEGEKRQNAAYQPSFRPWVSWGMKNEKNANGRQRMLMLPAGLVVPYIVDGMLHRITIRLLQPDPQNPKKKYHYVIGSMRDVWLSNPEARAFVVSEAELDCIAVDGAAGDLVGTVGIGSTGVKPEKRAAAALADSLCILNAMDYDLAGAKAGAWWSRTYPQTSRWPVPAGKDPGEAFAAGVDLRLWVLSGLPPIFHGHVDVGIDGGAPVDKSMADGYQHGVDGNGPGRAIIDTGYRVLEIAGGREICLTDDEGVWKSLASDGRIVFSSNELKRLQVACAELDPDEAEVLKDRVMDAKMVFGQAYIYRGVAHVDRDKT